MCFQRNKTSVSDRSPEQKVERRWPSFLAVQNCENTCTCWIVTLYNIYLNTMWLWLEGICYVICFEAGHHCFCIEKQNETLKGLNVKVWRDVRENKRLSLALSEGDKASRIRRLRGELLHACCNFNLPLSLRKVAINKIIKCDGNQYFHYSF